MNDSIQCNAIVALYWPIRVISFTTDIFQTHVLLCVGVCYHHVNHIALYGHGYRWMTLVICTAAATGSLAPMLQVFGCFWMLMVINKHRAYKPLIIRHCFMNFMFCDFHVKLQNTFWFCPPLSSLAMSGLAFSVAPFKPLIAPVAVSTERNTWRTWLDARQYADFVHNDVLGERDSHDVPENFRRWYNNWPIGRHLFADADHSYSLPCVTSTEMNPQVELVGFLGWKHHLRSCSF